MLSSFKCNHFKLIVFFQFRNYSKSANSNLTSVLETMPKEPKHIAEAQRQRLKIKERLAKYVPGRITLQVLGTGAEGAPRSLYVFSDQSRYLFNCGEGTQRLAHEHKMKLAKLEHIFITQRTWRNIGGLPGTALTIQDVGVPQITLHGPKGLEELFTATKRFIILRDLKIEMADCGEKSVFEDNVMTVHYVPIAKLKNVRIVYDTVKLENHEPPVQTAEDLNKAVQAENESVEVGTSTRREKNHNRRNSRSCSPSIPKTDEVEDNIDYYAHERKIICEIPFPKTIRSRSSRADSKHRNSNVSDKSAESARLSALKNNKDEAMCYICKLQPRPGALSLDKCVRLGVPSGPLLGRLKMGQDIYLPSGVLVKSKDVCEPDDPGPVFLVVDCPSEEYLDSFVNNAAFRKHQATAKVNDDLAYLVVHFTPQRVMDDPRYRAWIERFSPSTHHLVLNETNKCMGSISVHRVQQKLNLLNSIMFPLLGDKGSKVEGEEIEDASSVKRLKIDTDSKGDSIELSGNISPVDSKSHLLSVQSESISSNDSLTYANTFCNFHLRPRKGLDRSSELILTPKQYIEETMSEEGFPEILKDLQTVLRDKIRGLKVRPYPRLLFLGTGSCIPNKTRNTSGILLETSEHTNILIDCGEGTYGQIVRFFGPEKADHVLSNIKGIFISHLHADHHIGLIGLLQGRRRALDRLDRSNFHPLLLLAPKQILTWLNFYDKYFENICKEFELIANGDLVHDEQTIFEGTKVRINLTLEMTDICTALVRHCPNAFGIAFTHRSGYKMCYSGDTMPSENLINAGLNCDLLVHEATMEDELEQEAFAKMHSTTSQAIEVGRNMNAKHIILTHFSQRYAKIPRFTDSFGDNIGIAFDNMQVRLDELPLVPLIYPALKLMFAEHYEELETKAVKRQLKMDKKESETSDVNKNENCQVKLSGKQSSLPIRTNSANQRNSPPLEENKNGSPSRPTSRNSTSPPLSRIGSPKIRPASTKNLSNSRAGSGRQRLSPSPSKK